MSRRELTVGEAPLAELAAAIDREHAACEAAYRDALEHAFRAGELLIQARAQVPHGHWEAWLADHAAMSPRSARRYMQLARNRPRVADLAGVGEASRALASPRGRQDAPRRRPPAEPGPAAMERRAAAADASFARGPARTSWRRVLARLADVDRAIDLLKTMNALLPEAKRDLLREAADAGEAAVEEMRELADILVQLERR